MLLARSGTIDADELYQLMVSIGDDEITREEAHAMLMAADTDGNGEIDYEEFVAILTM